MERYLHHVLTILKKGNEIGGNMESSISKQPLWNLVKDFLVDDFSSWRHMDLSHCIRQKAINGEIQREIPQNRIRKKMAHETHTRAWAKSIVWRLWGIVILGTISWIITKSWKEVSLITVLFHSIRVILYYLHERAWERISWGRVEHPLSVFPVKKKLEPHDMKIIRAQLRELGYLD